MRIEFFSDKGSFFDYIDDQFFVPRKGDYVKLNGCEGFVQSVVFDYKLKIVTIFIKEE